MTKYKPINNFCIVEVEKAKEDTHILHTGTEILIDTDFNPGYYSRIHGTVLGIPPYLTADRELFIEDKLCDIEEEVMEGDKIYFHHNSCTEENQLEGNIFRVPYESIYCIVREGQIIPVGGRCFSHPVFEETNKTVSGIYLDWDTTPKPVKYRSGSGLARITHVGKPLKGKKQEAKQGDIVLYTPASDFPRKIEGDVYYILRSHIDIVAIITNTEHQ